MSDSIFSVYGDNSISYVHGVGHTGRSSPFHHPKGSFFVFEYILSGEECVESPDFLIKAGIGDLIVIHPSEECVIYKNKNEVSALYFFISGFVLEAVFEVLALPRISCVPASLIEEFLNIGGLYEKYLAGDPNSGKKLCEFAFSLMLHTAAANNNNLTNEKPSAEKIKDYLDLCLCGEVDLDSVGKKFGITGMHVIRLFRQKYDYTPMQYLKLKRLEKAASLLSNSNMSIKDISSLLCFSSTQHFTNLFREQFNISPGKYRESFVQQEH